jgi:RNA polymerase sigma factor (sigma-70 family)
MRPGPALSDEEEFIPTRDSLLSRLKDWRDDDSWRDFFNTYWKLVYGVAIKGGLTDQEAQEVVQETVITVARRIPEFKYDPGVCSFKTWLLNLTRWRIVDQLRRRRPDNVDGSGRNDGTARTAIVDRLVDPTTLNLDAVWDEQWHQHLLEAAITRVKRQVNPEHYQMFHLCVFKDWPPPKVARELGVSASRVYLAKHRVAAQLKREIKKLEKQLS